MTNLRTNAEVNTAISLGLLAELRHVTLSGLHRKPVHHYGSLQSGVLRCTHCAQRSITELLTWLRISFRTSCLRC